MHWLTKARSAVFLGRTVIVFTYKSSDADLLQASLRCLQTEVQYLVSVSFQMVFILCLKMTV